MSLLQFYLAPHLLAFEVGGQYPAEFTSRLFQVQDRTAGGTMEVETLGILSKTRQIVFVNMPKADYDGLVNWFDNIAQASYNVFEFTDEYGIVFNVRVVDSEIRFKETKLDCFSGTLTLELV